MENREIQNSLRDARGNLILVGSAVRLSEQGRKDFGKVAASIIEDMPNFRGKVVRIDYTSNLVYMRPIEFTDDEILLTKMTRGKNLEEDEIRFAPEQIIVE
jgi:hypothetical protein